MPAKVVNLSLGNARKYYDVYPSDEEWANITATTCALWKDAYDFVKDKLAAGVNSKGIINAQQVV